jgi:hypothetical protein
MSGFSRQGIELLHVRGATPRAPVVISCFADNRRSDRCGRFELKRNGLRHSCVIAAEAGAAS